MIGIVGAGISGLALARELERRGIECLAVEASERPGGAIHSLRADGHVLEMGPQRMRLTPPVGGLVRELGLEERLLTAASDLPLHVYHAGRLRRVPLRARDLARTDLLSWRGKLRLLREPLIAPPRQQETAGAFLRRKLGDEAYERVAAPLYGGLYAGDPDHMPARFALEPLLRELGAGRSLLLALARRRRAAGGGAPAISFRNGLQELPEALRRDQSERVVLRARVRRIARRGAGYVLLTHGSTATLECERVVLTVPADTAASLLNEVAPAAGAALASLHHNPLAVVHLESDCGAQGLGYQVAHGEQMATRGVTFNASLFGRDRVFTAFLGGAQNPGIVGMPDDWVGETACNEFRQVTGCDARVLRITRSRVPAWDESWSALDRLELPDGIHLLTNYNGRLGIPSRLRLARELAERLAAG